MSKRKLSDEQEAEARAMRGAGHLLREIAVVFSVSIPTISRALDPQQVERCRLYAIEYHKTHVEEEREYEKARWRDNKEHERERFKEWYDENKAHDNAMSTKYRLAHMDEDALHSATRRALIKGATIGNLEEIAEIYRQAREDEPIRCYLCGELIPLGDRHVDHKHPLAKGGDHTPSNLRITHSWCNQSKHDKVL